jgi:hypothetical protein
MKRALRYMPEDDADVYRFAKEAWADLRAQELSKIEWAIWSGLFNERLDAAGLGGTKFNSSFNRCGLNRSIGPCQPGLVAHAGSPTG